MPSYKNCLNLLVNFHFCLDFNLRLQLDDGCSERIVD